MRNENPHVRTGNKVPCDHGSYEQYSRVAAQLLARPKGAAGRSDLACGQGEAGDRQGELAGRHGDPGLGVVRGIDRRGCSARAAEDRARSGDVAEVAATAEGAVAQSLSAGLVTGIRAAVREFGGAR